MKTMRVYASEIEYDTDGVSIDWLKNEGANLPSELWLEIDANEINENNSSLIADTISDVTGFCVFTFQYEAYSN